MTDISELIPYIYAGVTALNTAFFIAKGSKDTKYKIARWGFVVPLIASLDMLPILWNDSETFSQKLGLKDQSIDTQNLITGLEITLMTVGNFAMGYHNLGLGKHDKKFIRRNKIRQSMFYTHNYISDLPKKFGEGNIDLKKLIKENKLSYDRTYHIKKYEENIKSHHKVDQYLVGLLK